MTLPGTSSRHLTDTQFAQCFTGEPVGIDVHRHLAVCEPCRAEVAAFGGSIDRLGKAALKWSASQRVALPARTSATWQAAWLPAGAPLRWATAAIALALVASPLAFYRSQNMPGPGATSASALHDSDVDIAQDNSLLQSVDHAIAETDTDQSPFQQYQLAPASGNASGAAPTAAGGLSLP